MYIDAFFLDICKEEGENKVFIFVRKIKRLD